ncbi:MAG: dimethylarginine dimethylaminohydrolase family protein [Bryobacteraceae bacterium]
MLIAITRAVSPRINECVLTHVAREPIDEGGRARLQHQLYEQCLEETCCQLFHLPAEPKLPDSVFVEDTAIVLDELAVMTTPGAEPRRAETASVAEVLRQYRRLFHIQPPGTLDGGDVLRVARTLYVGLSKRSNPQGIEQLRRLVTPFGYSVTAVPLHDCLHLKSAVTQVADQVLLINRQWVDGACFGSMALALVRCGLLTLRIRSRLRLMPYELTPAWFIRQRFPGPGNGWKNMASRCERWRLRNSPKLRAA